MYIKIQHSSLLLKYLSDRIQDNKLDCFKTLYNPYKKEHEFSFLFTAMNANERGK
jgi:hypothetical protein